MENETFEFRTVEDFLQLNEEQFNRFLPDFIHWFAIRKAFVTKQQVAIEGTGVIAQINPEPVIKWKDDGKVGVDGYEVTIIHRREGGNDIKIRPNREVNK
ncbi:TPA: hypothetical protein ACPDRN_000291 [Pasteurella multocida]|nr:hypothetical protein [Pasteurella multocida]HDR1506111.1 hypothetical protein [Pasteurella multocida]HDR1586532.1 hypothetical protein [Pasteurella multocida]HDR1913044.1 hypothetical protein [Pasteurella multocida]